MLSGNTLSGKMLNGKKIRGCAILVSPVFGETGWSF